MDMMGVNVKKISFFCRAAATATYLMMVSVYGQSFDRVDLVFKALAWQLLVTEGLAKKYGGYRLKTRHRLIVLARRARKKVGTNMQKCRRFGLSFCLIWRPCLTWLKPTPRTKTSKKSNVRTGFA